MAQEVWFYHLESQDLPQALGALLEKGLAKGWRAIVRSADAAQLEALDAGLWTFRDDSFLPHGREGPDAPRHPILLTDKSHNPNGAKALFLVAGAPPEAIEGYERVCLVFDGREEAAVARARGHWKAVKERGLIAVYWKQSPSGAWQKKA